MLARNPSGKDPPVRTRGCYLMIGLGLLLGFGEGRALAGGFGGFTADGAVTMGRRPRVYLARMVDGKGRAPAGRPVSRALPHVAAASRLDGGFVADDLVASVVATTVVEIRRSDHLVVTWDAKAPVKVLSPIHSSKDALTLALVVTFAGDTALAVFRLDGASPDTAAAAGRARVMGRGGLWEQQKVACERAGVRLDLALAGTFRMTTETRCHQQKDSLTVAGKWTVEGDDLVLALPQDDGPDESLRCHLATCIEAPGEDCLQCLEDDLAFTLLARRR